MEKNGNIYSNHKGKGYTKKVFTTDMKTKNKKLDEGFSVKLKEEMQDTSINKIAVFSFIGKAGRGKSTLASLFVNYLEKLNGFEPSHSETLFESSKALKTKTVDLYCYGKLLKIPDTDFGILVMDCQGDGTIPESGDEDEQAKEKLNMEKNLFIAMSTSSVTALVLETRLSRGDSQTLKYFQNIFSRIKKTVNISYPGVILLRNQTSDLKIDTKNNREQETDERKEYIDWFIKNSSINNETVKNLFATCFPTLSRKLDNGISSDDNCLNSELVKNSFDYIIDVIKKYPKYLDRENGIFMDASTVHEQIKNIIQQINEIDDLSNFKHLVNPISEIIKNKIKLEYMTIKEHFTKIFREISKNILSYTVDGIQLLITKEKKIVETLMKFENVDKKAFDYHMIKIERFISSNLSVICNDLIYESYINKLTELEKEIEIEKSKINPLDLSEIEKEKNEFEKKKLENELADITHKVGLKSESLRGIDDDIKNKIDEYKKEVEKYNYEQLRTLHVSSFRQKISEFKINMKTLDDHFNEKANKKCSLESEIQFKNSDIAILNNKVKKYTESSEEEINYLKKNVKDLEAIQDHNSIKCNQAKLDFKHNNDQLNKLEKEISLLENKLAAQLTSYQNVKIEVKKLQIENYLKDDSHYKKIFHYKPF